MTPEPSAFEQARKLHRRADALDQFYMACLAGLAIAAVAIAAVASIAGRAAL